MMISARTFRAALFGFAACCTLGASVFAPSDAAARTSVGIGIGIPLYGPGYYAPPAYPYPYSYGSPYYAPPPAYYAPSPPPAYYDPQPGAYAPPDDGYGPDYGSDYGQAPQENCREVRSSATINGQRQWVYGTACQQPDGNWRNVD